LTTRPASAYIAAKACTETSIDPVSIASSGAPVFRYLIRAIKIVLLTGMLSGILFLANDLLIARNAEGRLYWTVEYAPRVPVALVLGTSKYVNGVLNVYYTARIQAAADLFHAGKVKGILVSGDNATPQYNEPTRMKKDLIALGVPTEYITQDYAGFRTLDSIVRARKVFDLDRVVIVSQQFHCERALYIADAVGLPAVGFCARDAPPVYSSFMVRSRETLARALAFIDVNVVDRQPKFLGKKEYVHLRKEEG
jgi:SanA protein